MYGYTLLPNPNQQQPQQPQPGAIQITDGKIPTDVIIEQIVAQTRQINAQSRIQESLILLNAMAEIRFALNIPSVADNDTGQSERAPLKPMFDPDRVEQLQHGYTRMMEKYFKFVDHVMRVDYKITAKDEPKPPHNNASTLPE